MSKPLSERLEELVQGCHGPRSSVIREAIALARRVEGAEVAHANAGFGRNSGLIFTTAALIEKRVRLVPEVES